MLNLIGLPNISNTCYINCALQVLNHNIFFNIFLQTYPHNLNFFTLFSKNNNQISLYKKYLNNLINYFPKYFNILEQNDVHEFMILFIDILFESIKLNYDNVVDTTITPNTIHNKWFSNYSPIQDIFYFQSIQQIQCSNCLHENINIEMSCIICVEQNMNIQLALDKYFQSHFINDWKCDKCNIVNNNNRLSLFLTKLPKTFIICIKRFDNIRKSESNEIPNILDFDKYSIKNTKTQYKLSSTIEHIGSLSYGHYFTNIIYEDTIYQIDDLNIRKIDSNTLYDRNTYILLYQQT